MATSYTYSITSDFTNATDVDIKALQIEITDDATISVDPDYITNTGDDVEIFFPSSLSAGQKTGLDTLVAAYTFVPIPRLVSTTNEVIVSNDVNYSGDYSSISAAFDAGAKSVYVKNGTYVQTADIVIPDGGQIVGESQGNVIIYFIGAYSVKIDGSSGTKETTGTISIPNNSTTITGVGTTFTNLIVGNFIQLGTNYYEILSITSDTSLEIKYTYVGAALTGVIYCAQAMYTGCTLQRLVVSNSSGPGIYVRALRHGKINSVVVHGCSPAVQILDSADMSLQEIIPVFTTGIGLSVSNCLSFSLNTINTFNSTSHGVEITGNCVNINGSAIACENNNGHGLCVLSPATFINMSNSIMKNNNKSGIYSQTGTNFMTIDDCDISFNNENGIEACGEETNVSNCVITNNNENGVIVGKLSMVEGNTIKSNTNHGVDLSMGCVNISDNIINFNGGNGINAEYNKISIAGNNIHNSSAYGIYVTSAKNRIQSNCLFENLNGIYVSTGSNNNIISNNIVDTNIGNGLELATGSANNIVTANNFSGNTGTNFLDNGTGTIDANNIV